MSLRTATKEDMHLQAYDNTKLVAYNTCPVFGILRYQMHRVMNERSRAMALEAGTALHEVFAFVRLMNVWIHLREQGKFMEATSIVENHGTRMYGAERWRLIYQTDGETFIDNVKHNSLRVLETGGFYDDDRDRYRTLTNLEEAALAYIDKWNWKLPVWVRNVDDPCTDIGVEHAFDLVMCDSDIPLFRFTGKIDGLRWHGNKLTIEDNKTTSRITDAWEMGFELSHQVTGYMVAASLFAGSEVRNAEVIGLQIPQPVGHYSGYARVPLEREPWQFTKWIRWMLHTVEGYETYQDRPHEAPQYTHSCVRYFRPCTFIPFCAADEDEKARIIEEMVVQEWSPLHVVGDTGE